MPIGEFGTTSARSSSRGLQESVANYSTVIRRRLVEAQCYVSYFLKLQNLIELTITDLLSKVHFDFFPVRPTSEIVLELQNT